MSPAAAYPDPDREPEPGVPGERSSNPDNPDGPADATGPAPAGGLGGVAGRTVSRVELSYLGQGLDLVAVSWSWRDPTSADTATGDPATGDSAARSAAAGALPVLARVVDIATADALTALMRAGAHRVPRCQPRARDHGPAPRRAPSLDELLAAAERHAHPTLSAPPGRGAARGPHRRS